MKALFLPNLSFEIDQIVDVSGEDYHHIVIVQRIQKNEKILLLNGSGIGFLSSVLDITKKNLKLEVIEKINSQIINKHSVLILIPKKDALDQMIKSCIEMSVREIILVRGDHSVEKLPEMKKVEKIMKQAIEQSNSFFEHKLFITTLKDFDFNQYKSVNILDTIDSQPTSISNSALEELLVVGPEGGFSNHERELFKKIKGLRTISLSTNILRSPTAMIAGLGWLYAKK